MSVEFLLLASVFLLLLLLYYKQAHSYWKNRSVPQLHPTFPFGDMASVIFRKQNMGDKIKEIYDTAKSNKWKYVGLYFFSRKALLAVDPNLIKNILCRDFQHFNDRGIYYDEEGDPLSAHLFSLAGVKWKNLRSKLTPAFSPGKLKYLFASILNCGEEMLDVLQQTAKTDNNIEIKEVFARYTTDVIGSCAFGLECNSMKNPNAEFRRMGKRAFTQTLRDSLSIIVIRSFPKLAKMLRLGVFAPSVTRFFQNVVTDTIEYREKHNITRSDFLQLLIQLKNNGRLDDDCEEKVTKVPPGTALTMEEAAAQAFIFFLAGFETTSTTISFALFEMTLDKHIQTRARKEVQQIFKKHGGQLSYDAVMEMQYLEMIILETMRKYPPAPVFLRKCTEAYKIPETDVVIEEGLSVLIPAYGMHRDPEYFPEPERFDPERFSQENKSKIWDYTYIPFGDGPRLCIGQRFAMIQTKIALSLLLLNFEFALNSKTIFPLKMESKGIILNPVGGLWIDFNPINIP